MQQQRPDKRNLGRYLDKVKYKSYKWVITTIQC